MDTAVLLATLREKGVKLWVSEGKLKCSAPVGALDADNRKALVERTNDIKEMLLGAEESKTHAALVPINPGGNAVPVFVVSGHGGDVFYLLRLARQLDPEQPVFGVRPPGLDGTEPLTSVEALASYAIDQIRRYRPNGPYLIAGHCAGGTIAFEVAQQLTAAGYEVALLALIGSPFCTRFRRTTQAIQRIGRFAKAMTLATSQERRRYIATKLRSRMASSQSPADSDPTMAAARIRVENATMAAVRVYRPQVYHREIDLFITADKWHHSDRWRDVAASARVHHINNLEIDDLLLGPDVGRLARPLQSRLREVSNKLLSI